MNNRVIVIYCGLLLSLTAFSIDIILPAFSLISQELAAPYSRVQLLVPTFLVAIGIGHLVNGSLSDRFGRKPVVQIGLMVYIIGAVICAMTNDIDTLLMGRIIQGLGASAGPVVARSIIRDLYSGKQLARAMALAMAVFAFGPIVAPLVGAAMLLYFSWQVLFISMIVFCISLLVFSFVFLPETNKNTDPKATKPSVFVGNIVRLFANPQSRFFIVLSGIVMTMIMIILINSPIIFMENFGISSAMFAVMFAVHGLGIIIGQIGNRHLIDRLGIEKTTLIGSAALVVISLVIVGISVAGWMSAWLLAGLMVAHATSYLVVYANSAAMTLDPHGDIAGFTSSFYGFFSQVTSSAIGAALSIWIAGSLINWAAFLLILSAITFVSLFFHNAKQSN